MRTRPHAGTVTYHCGSPRAAAPSIEGARDDCGSHHPSPSRRPPGGRHHLRPGPRGRQRHRQDLEGCALRRRARRRTAMARTPAAAEVDRTRRRVARGSGVPPTHRSQDPDRPRRTPGRRFPVAQCLGTPRHPARRRQAGDGVGPRRSLRPRLCQPAALPRRRAGHRRRRDRRDRQLPARRIRLPGTAHPGRRQRTLRHQPRSPRRARRPGVGPRQHRRLRWGPGQGDVVR